jgi:hypothetical protein
MLILLLTLQRHLFKEGKSKKLITFYNLKEDRLRRPASFALVKLASYAYA